SMRKNGHLKLVAFLLISIFAMSCQSSQELPSSDTAPQPAIDVNAEVSTESGTISAVGEPQPINLVSAFSGTEFERPIEIGGYPGNRVFVAEQDGRIYLLSPNNSEKQVLADLRSQVSRTGNEEGLLSVALDPNFDQNQHIWLYYSVNDGPRRTRLARFTVQADQIDLNSELVILEQGQPYSNHNGGAVRFGPDQMLYLGLGDGGSGGDPQGHGQQRDTLLGSIIRIDVRDATRESPYKIPNDNPFIGADGRPEIWAYGIRNPWRMAFDSTNGNLWLGDVGQNAFEEIDIIQRGGNYGWKILEGDRCYEPAQNCDGSSTIAPVVVYGRSDGCSVTGGLVYRDNVLPEIANTYLYGDFCSGTIWGINADTPTNATTIASNVGSVSSFGQDSNNNVYVLQFNGPILMAVSN
ncbi:MAG: PQQ-dependent sugar dehydrogenase, partial [Chloroflexota bacterium]